MYAEGAMTADGSFADRYGPWALITGASSGIGRAMADEVAAAGVPHAGHRLVGDLGQ